MIVMECKIGPVTLSLQSDSQVHPEVVETLLRQVTVHAAIAFTNAVEEGRKRGVAVVDEGD